MTARPRSRDGTLMTFVVLTQAALVWLFASRSYFFQDDFVNLFHASQARLTPAWLTGNQIGHFAPGQRLLTFTLWRAAGFDFSAALATLLAIQSIGVVLIQRNLALLFGSRGWTFAVAFAYGISVLLMPSFQWYSAGSLTLPEATLAVASIHAYLCWWRGRSRAWLWWSVTAMVGALLFSEKAVLVPVWLVLMRVLLLNPEARLGTSVRAVAREWRVWALYALPLTVYLIVYLTRDYTGTWHLATTDALAEYLWRGWLHGFTPGLLGVRVTPASSEFVRVAGVGACQLTLAVVAAASIVRRRSAWRAWVFLVLAFLLNSLLFLSRLDFGPNIAYSLRYYTDLTFLAAIALPCAFDRPVGTLAEAGAGHGRRVRPGPRAIALAAAGLAGYVGLVAASDASLVHQVPAKASRHWVQNIEQGVRDRETAAGGPMLLDAHTPLRVLPFWIYPGVDRLAQIVPLFASEARFGGAAKPTYRVSEDGHLRAVRFRPAFGGGLADLRREGTIRVAATSTSRQGDEACIAPTPLGGGIEIVPRRPLVGRPWFLEATYRTGGRAELGLQFDRGTGYLPGRDATLPGRRLTASTVTEIGAQFAGRREGVPTVRRFKIVTPPQQSLCISRLVVGSFES
jgi:hypothetical protein